MYVQLTSLGERPCWVPPPRACSNDQWDFMGSIVWFLREGALVPGDFLILDNARIHHGNDVFPIIKRLLDLKGVQILYLPAYSPELNPCELVFGYVKQRMNTYRGTDPMWLEALRWFASVPSELMESYYRHCILGPVQQ